MSEDKLIKDLQEVSPILDVSINDLNEVLEEIRPYIAMDGGDMVIEGIRGLSVYVRLKGACDGCTQANMTLQYGVEELLKDKVHSDIEVVPLEGELS